MSSSLGLWCKPGKQQHFFFLKKNEKHWKIKEIPCMVQSQFQKSFTVCKENRMHWFTNNKSRCWTGLPAVCTFYQLKTFSTSWKCKKEVLRLLSIEGLIQYQTRMRQHSSPKSRAREACPMKPVQHTIIWINIGDQDKHSHEFGF